MVAGSYNLASQKGMSIGGVRHVGDLKVDKMTTESERLVTAQAGK